jgi:hypothetical protein
MFVTRIHPSSQRLLQHRHSGRAATILPRASNPSKFDSAGLPDPSLGVLQDRIKQLRSKQQAEQSLRMRPALPQNVLMMDEVEAGEMFADAIDHGCNCVQVPFK